MYARRITVTRCVLAASLAMSFFVSTSCATVAPRPIALSDSHEEPELVQTTHTVAAGETLYRIAKTYGVSVEQLMLVNGIDDVKDLAIGTLLVIPDRNLSNETDGLAREATASVTDEKATEPSSASAARTTGPKEKRAPVIVGRTDGVLSWPLRGVIYARFGSKGKEPHDGIDLAAPAGTPVKTASPGTVMFSGEQKGYGLIVIVEHANQLITLYAHNRDLRVKTGQQVRAGQVVSTVGDSGRTSGPHLHFEVRQNGIPKDPLLFLGPVPPQ
jgi:lipoprotein NlpD